MQSAFLTHAVPGRARIRIPSRRGDGLFFTTLEARLKQCAGVSAVSTNIKAASVLIVYASDGELQTILDYARRHRLFAMAPHEPRPLKTLPEVFAAQVADVDQLLSTASRGRVDLQSVFFLLFLGLGLRQLWRGEIMQPAIPLLWRVMEIIKDLNESTKR